MSKKYKHLTKIQDLRLIPSRVLKFKKSKWTKLKSILTKKFQSLTLERKKLLLKTNPRLPIGFKTSSTLLNFSRKLQIQQPVSRFKIKSKLKIYDKFKTFVNKGRFSYLSSLSRDKCQSHLKLKYLLNQNNMVTRQECKDRDSYIKNIYNDSFCLKGVTSSFYFFNSPRDVKDKLKAGMISINDKRIIKYTNLTKGDIVKVDSTIVDIKKNMKALFSNYVLPSHLESDIYSQTIVMIKDKSMTSQDDYHLISLEYINAQKI